MSFWPVWRSGGSWGCRSTRKRSEWSPTWTSIAKTSRQPRARSAILRRNSRPAAQNRSAALSRPGRTYRFGCNRLTGDAGRDGGSTAFSTLVAQLFLAGALLAVLVGLEVLSPRLFERRVAPRVEEELQSRGHFVSPLVVEARPNQVHRHPGHRQKRRAQHAAESRPVELAVPRSGEGV